jgi:hypothetical protein
MFNNIDSDLIQKTSYVASLMNIRGWSKSNWVPYILISDKSKLTNIMYIYQFRVPMNIF